MFTRMGRVSRLAILGLAGPSNRVGYTGPKWAKYRILPKMSRTSLLATFGLNWAE